MDYVAQTDGLSKQYRRFKALDGLNMNIPKGAIYGFVGKNGAGKTTLVRLLCGLQEPTAGGYTLYGRKHTDREIGKSRRRMGAVVETPSVYMDLTARENLEEQYRVLGLPWACASASGLPWRSAAIPIFWCWTSRPTALIRRGSLRSGN